MLVTRNKLQSFVTFIHHGWSMGWVGSKKTGILAGRVGSRFQWVGSGPKIWTSVQLPYYVGYMAPYLLKADSQALVHEPSRCTT